MNIFESLANLPVSEECFDNILSIVENILVEGWAENHTMGDVRRAAGNSVDKRYKELRAAERKHGINVTNQHKRDNFPDVKRAYNRYSQACALTAGRSKEEDQDPIMRAMTKTDQKIAKKKGNILNIDAEANKVYPDNMKISTALKKRPESNTVEYNITPHIKSLGKAKA